MHKTCFKILAIFSFVILSLNLQAGDFIKSDRLLFDFYSPQWVNGPKDLNTNPTFSFAVSWGKDVPFKKSNFSWFYALGYDFNNIQHNANLKSLPIGSVREVGMRLLNTPYSLNKLSTHYLEIPIEFRYRTQTKNPFRVYLGTKTGYMVKSHYEIDEGKGETYERKGLDELERLKYGVTLRVGYGLVNFYAYYGLNGLMTPDKQKGVNQLSFGLTLMAN